jgi:hypothetical protein
MILGIKLHPQGLLNQSVANTAPQRLTALRRQPTKSYQLCRQQVQRTTTWVTLNLVFPILHQRLRSL